jgi:RNA polymerase sigma-54 factor
MELGPLLEQRLTATPQLILANTLLRLSSTELEQAIAQELAENPALELIEVQRCPGCGRAMPDGYCSSCGGRGLGAEKEDIAYSEYNLGGTSSSSEYDANDQVGDERDDGISRLTSSTALADHLLSQVRLSLPPQDWPIAAWLVESLDDHGFLSCDPGEAASLCGVDRVHVESVISAVQQLDPVGVAARDARECLLVQLAHLARERIEQPLAKVLVEEHWEALSRRSFAEIARAERTTVDEVKAALQFIKDNLNPFPAHAHWADLHESPPEKEAIYPNPDIIISERSDGEGYEIELPMAQVYRLRVSASHLEAMEALRANRASSTERNWEQWEAFYARARLFIKSVEQRWRTLYRLARHLVDYQRDFLAHGDRCLKPFTRAQLADVLGVHESTVSRAVAGKYAQLPTGRVIPLAKFFDSSAAIKEIIRELIAQESKPLSDKEIAEELVRQGHRVARRTVTKYRNALNILPSSLR